MTLAKSDEPFLPRAVAFFPGFRRSVCSAVLGGGITVPGRPLRLYAANPPALALARLKPPSLFSSMKWLKTSDWAMR